MNKIINFLTLAWIEGAAIMVAVLLVAGVGSFVDWRKELQFVSSRAKSEEKNVVSIFIRSLPSRTGVTAPFQIYSRRSMQ